MKQFNTLLTLVFAVLMMCGSALNAQTITIGTATGSNSTTAASPINIWYRSLRYQTVYTAAELTGAGASTGAILQMGFNVTGVPLYALPNYTIRMKHTTATNAAAHDGVGLTQVYNVASYTPVAGGFDMLTLQTPFAWNGTDNILIDICFDQVPNYDQSGQISIFTSTLGARYIRADSAPQCGLNTGTTLGEKPVIQMVLGTPPSCSMPGLPAFNSITSTSAAASWTPTGTPTSYIIEYGVASGFVVGSGTIVTSTATNYSLTNLTPATDYVFRVRAVCGTAVGDTSFASVGYFSTDCPASLMAPITESFNGAGLACLTTANSVLNSGGGWQTVGWVAAASSFYSAPLGYDAGNFCILKHKERLRAIQIHCISYQLI
ncbi:MAG: fibronectin type III domain-containing protein [Saprospiraceae bacterium]|nr:fibronectin type III domain-containing protein [Saprospiraceae bacterium]